MPKQFQKISEKSPIVRSGAGGGGLQAFPGSSSCTLLPRREDRRAEEGPARPRGLRERVWIFTDLDRSLEGSFSAGSPATIATKYSFCRVFRDLQNYLATFSKNLQNFAKNQRFSQKSALFLRKSGNFAKVLQNSAIFCKILQLFQKSS